MPQRRYIIGGYPDYRGVQLPDLIGDLKEYRDTLKQAIEEFQSLKLEVEKYAGRLDNPQELLNCVVYFISLFSGHLEDIRRLVEELPLGVKEKHIEIVKQIYESCKYENKTNYRAFKEEFISRELKDESMRYLLDKICQLFGGVALDLCSLGDLNTRLGTFLGDSLDEKKAIDEKLEKTSIPGIEIPPDTRWEDIKLEFLDHEEIKIFLKNKPRAVKSYIALDFADKRTDKIAPEEGKPSRLWRTLALFAKGNGEISWENTHFSEKDNLVKNVSDLRKHLKALFRINASPIVTYKRSKKTIYKMALNISPINTDLFERIAGWVGGTR
jgi:hypothetical protein